MLNMMLAMKLALESMMKKSFAIKSQKGVTMIEYSLIAALIAVAAIAVLPDIGTQINAAFQNVSTAFTDAGFAP
jgi:pilus assembly protein Flp/PilA